jgi:hypothetical protein
MQMVAECMQMTTECAQMTVEYRWMAECRWTAEHRWMAMYFYGRDSERILIIQNMFGGNIGSVELCWRYYRYYRTVLGVT